MTRDTRATDRRTVLRTIGGLAGAGVLAGAATDTAAAADPPDERLSRHWWTAWQNTREGAVLPTVFLVDDPSGLDQIETLGFDGVTTTTETETPAAYARVSVDFESLRAILRLDAVTTVLYAPGANPFWLLEHYADRVFPTPTDAVDYVSYPEFVQGVDHLASEYSDTLRHTRVAQSPGHLDVEAGETTREDVHVVEVTENVTDREAFARREKVVVTLGIHGDERAGVEAGVRFLERLCRGEADASDALADTAYVFVFPNPDGWVARLPFTVDGRFGAGVNPPGNAFERVTGTDHDPNRQYPTVGWIDPGHRPAEPRGANLVDDAPGVDGDVPTTPHDYYEEVPGALGVVEHLRGYDDVAWVADFHGMFGSEELVKLLAMNASFEYEDAYAIFDFAAETESALDDAVGDLLKTTRPALESRAEAVAEEYGIDRTPPVPSTTFTAGTIFDMVRYNTTGGFASWASRPTEAGGLGARGVALEMAWDNRVGDGMSFDSEVVELQSRAYETVLETLASHETASPTVETPAEQTVTVVDGDDTGATAAELPFPTADTAAAASAGESDDGESGSEGSGDGESGSEGSGDGEEGDASGETGEETGVTSTAVPVSVRAGETTSVPVPVEAETDRLAVVVDTTVGALEATLYDPDGVLVRTVERRTLATRPNGQITWGVSDPADGEWRVELSNTYGERLALGSVTTRVETGRTRDPRVALGYEQRDYDVSITDVIPDYEPATDGGATFTVTGPTDLADDPSGPVVVPTDTGVDRPEYVQRLGELLTDGETIVVTDSGLELLGADEFPLDVSGDDVERVTGRRITLGNRVEEHSLLTGTRSDQLELARGGPVGYASRMSEVPMYGIAPDAFDGVGGTVAARRERRSGTLVTAGTVSVGSGELVVIGGLLPRPSQENLHPFGLAGHGVTHLGYTVLANALGHSPPSP
ncbi:M14 family zinc carboxypeptidase [Halobaculum sp. MBLA0147]|uniref:M14 family zinc carboxypeptidase n=1 Tax=Halobaculum sp. MBLA0147 TaxID=3079934 RepID=UPI0035260D7C